MKTKTVVLQILVIAVLLLGLLNVSLVKVKAESAITIPTPIAPSGKTADNTPTFKWTMATNAKNYRFQVYQESTLVYTKTVAPSACDTSECTNTPTDVLALGDYKWHVQAYISGIWKSYSAYKTFTVVSPIPTPLLPSGKTADNTPTYKWTKVPGATQYRYELYQGTSLVYTKTAASSACGATDCSNTPATSLAIGSYKWRVQAYLGGIWKAYSAHKTFSEVTPIPSLIIPSGLTNDTTPEYKWKKIVGATQYTYELYQGSTLVYSKLVDASICGSTECADSPEDELGKNNYKWRAKAEVGGVWKAFSSYKYFNLNPNPFTGSGKLDGNGIPSDFFEDVHIRKAFSYCFDWDTYINDVYGGKAVQSLELPLPGMPGYDESAPHYTINLVKAQEEFGLADLDHDGIAAKDDTEGDVLNVGFKFKLPYNDGNIARQKIAEIFAVNLASVSPNFLAEPFKIMTWDEYSAAQNANQLPIMLGGWLEDLHDPHNWYVPYTIGSYGTRQNMPGELIDQFRTLVNTGVTETDPAARASIYYDLNQLYFDEAVGIPTALTQTKLFEQRWVSGRIQNPLFYHEVYYYPIQKAAPAPDLTISTSRISGDINTLDPALAYDTNSATILRNIYETLIFFEGEKTDEFIPQLAESWELSTDGMQWTFHIREGVTFHDGGTLTPSDVAYSFQRGLLQGGGNSPQWLLAEAFFGVGKYDITYLVDDGASMDNRDLLKANNPVDLMAACETVISNIVADDVAGTVTMKLEQPWGPFLATIANTFGSIMDQEWVNANGGWDGDCITWQDYYAMQSSEDPFTPIANGTGPYALEERTEEKIELTANEDYWRTDPAYSGGPSGVPSITTAIFKLIWDETERYNMLADRSLDFDKNFNADDLVGERCEWNPDTDAYVCVVEDDSKPLRGYFGRPNNLVQNVILYNFNIQ